MIKFITTTALVAASAALASAAVTTVELTDLVSADTTTFAASSNQQNYTTLGGYEADSSNATTSSATAEYVYSVLGSATTETFYTGTGTLKASDAIVSEIAGNTTSSFYLNARSGFRGEWAALVVSASAILGESDTATIDDLTTLSISYTSTAESYPVLTVWVIDGESATQISLTTTESNQQYTTSTSDEDEEVTVLSSVDVSATVSIADVVTETSTIVVLFSSTGVASTVTGLSVSTAIPEPSAFGLLAGLGALAFIASRRRRTK